LGYRAGRGAQARATVRTARVLLRLAARDFAAAIAMPGASTEGPQRSLWCGRCKGWLTRRDPTRLNPHLRAIPRLFGSGQGRRGARLHSFVFASTPVRARGDAPG